MASEEARVRSRHKIAEAARALLVHRRLPVILAVVSVVITLPALDAGLMTDDYYHRLVMRGSQHLPDVTTSPLDMFRFFDGDPQRTGRVVDYGLLPWWTYKKMKARFFRPLTVLTHWIDYRLWPESDGLAHAHSLLWFGALVGMVALLYRKIMGLTLVAGVAALLYAVADEHAILAGWLANRNALLAAFFGVAALLAHHRWRRNGWRGGVVLGPVLLALGLLSAEAGIGTCAYLAAYALFVDTGTAKQRWLSLVPYVAVVVIWRGVWMFLGYGVQDMGLYVDPLTEPARFALSIIWRTPILLLGQWALPPSEIVVFIGPRTERIVWFCGLGLIAILIAMLAPLLRRERTARFWAGGMCLALIPVCATFPADRLLIFAGIGAMGLLAQFLDGVIGRADWRPKSRMWRSAAVGLTALLILIHLVVSPIFLSLRTGFPMGPQSFTDQLIVRTPMDKSVEHQDVVIVNAPSPLHAAYLPIFRELDGQPVPRHTRVLAPGLPSVEIRRIDERTLTVRPEGGYLVWIFDRLFRSRQHPLSLGQRIELTGMVVAVTALTEDNRPAEAAFRFAVPLEDPSLRWLQWHGGEFVAWTPPAVGRTVCLRPKNPPF